MIQQGITGKELSIFSSRLNANKFPIVIDWLSKGLIKPEKLITHTLISSMLLMPLVYLNRIKNIAAKSYSLFLNNTNNGE
ncbi:dehydrogenase [Escherichia coli]|uniref:Dehydrogenase n=1 Tax=Escherichia coli TaxID=562 RepID=A0A376WZY9_ECOLX|nr:dehydrogenase [Escherichia coli]